MPDHKAIIFNLGGDWPLRSRPGGGHRVATELRLHGWDVEVVDHVSRWELVDLQELCRLRVDQNIKFFGFSQMYPTSWTQPVTEFVTWLKETWPEKHIIVGGPKHFNNHNAGIDYYFQGPSELSMMALFKHLYSNGSMPIYELVEGNKVIVGRGDLDAAPWKIPVIFYEDRDFLMPYEWLTVEFSRGCKFKCSFCNLTHLGVKGDFTRHPENFETQIRDAYDRFGVSSYNVADETFNDSTEKIKKYADVVQRLDFAPFFSGFIRNDILSNKPQQREELLRMGFLGHFYGIETFNDKAGRSVGKGGSAEFKQKGLLDSKEYFKSHGTNRYRGTISLIAGLPHETEESIDTTEEWLIENWKGENVNFWQHLIQDTNNYRYPSEVSRDIEKFGYRRLTDVELSAYDPADMNTDLVFWANEHTNYFRCLEKTRKFRKKTRGNIFRLGPYELSYLIRDLDIDQRLASYATKEFMASVKASEQAHVREYVAKKLSI
jgi:radical SAM superfamily enzyme YgiQ (UPF0313 family)